MASSSNLSLLTNIFTAPNEAFAALKERPRVLLPVLVLIVGYSVVSFYYLSHVDMGWFLDNQLRAGNANIPDAQREQTVAAATKLSPLFYGAVGALSANFAVFLVMLIVAVYYTVVSFVTRDGVKIGQWFALLCWCSMPGMLGQVAALVNMLINDPKFMIQDAVNPLAFGNLLSIDAADKTMLQRSLLGVNVTAIWGLVLQVLGYQSFTKSSFGKTVAVVLGPLALIVVIVSLFALRR
jgi:hypothetical protein